MDEAGCDNIEIDVLSRPGKIVEKKGQRL